MTAKDDKLYSSAGSPDYVGPVSTAKDSKTTESKSDRFTVKGDINYSEASSPATGSLPAGAIKGKSMSGGVLNGKANSLPRPPYPPAARAVRASGAVSVQVLIDTNGEVFLAHAVSGHPLLRPAAVMAACRANFLPTLLDNQPVKVSGIITYNFVP